ncbi:hypothetical protein SAMN04488515_3179 [Cognatiyoonia koreensis]|uniref:Uncharacterized protein n=1 Tax=Cognatiyoonia koreensis TaxID=364200 RepID=A0A1I0RSL7_9RHOB|nr:hypothetical protein [Cognatiyoonia koreensis]SEW44306.1 hypothetical protein SAMN04488515_3179 [Cognatiyoonia koreensis]
MRKTLKTACLTLVLLALLDVLVAMTLSWAERTGRFGSLVYFFDYGRSVPGKLARWEAEPNLVGNLYDIGWRSETVASSAASFAKESSDTGPFIRSYGMSFTLNIRDQALALRPDLNWESHAGPAGSPNFTYALFQDDRANRREGDIVVLGILSSVVPAMATHSNQTRVFEQPAPLTYPIYQPDTAGGLVRIDPLITTPEEHRALASDPVARAEWYAQLDQNDAYYSKITYGAPWLDASPLARLTRRALAQSHLDDVASEFVGGDIYPYETVLPRMISEFAKTARDDGQFPVVMLVQTNRRFDPDILAITKSTMDAEGIPYLATAELFDPTDLSGYLGDGHYTPQVDRMFAQHLIDMLDL